MSIAFNLTQSQPKTLTEGGGLLKASFFAKFEHTNRILFAQCIIFIEFMCHCLISAEIGIFAPR